MTAFEPYAGWAIRSTLNKMRNLRRGSIAASLFWLTAGWLVIALVATSFLLTELYSRALDQALAETLDFQIEALAGAAIENGPSEIPATAITDPRFNRLASGWYWEIRDQDDGEVLSSSSSRIGSVLPDFTTQWETDNRRMDRLEDGYGNTIRAIQRRVNLEQYGTLIITATGNLDEIQELVSDFRGQTLIVLGVIGALLATMSVVLARFALRPVTRLRHAVEGVREGEAADVSGNYPRELAPLAFEINALLSSNAQIVERARSQVGNLAHGLKTPLAVLRNEAASSQTELGRIVSSEAEKMAGMVTTYLDRARLSARTSVVGKRADARASLDRLVRVMQRLHPEREISLEMPKTGALWFRGDEADLEDIAGNILDNACKWAKGRVQVSLEDVTGDQTRMLRLIVGDDGPGLTEDQMKLVTKRGVRLDEKTPGSGLGLDIVKELIDIYGGNLELGHSELGGLRVQIDLPAARQRAE